MPKTLTAPVLFVASPSPGAVIRFLERQAVRTAAPLPAQLWLSDATGPHGFRALFPADDSLAALLPALAAAFPPGVYWLTADGWRHAAPDGTETRGTFPPPPTRPWQRLLAPPPAATLWARSQALPLERVLQRPATVVDYETVTTLDQRNLLVERNPCLYRFALPQRERLPTADGYNTPR